jgi:thymidine phosphorylase
MNKQTAHDRAINMLQLRRPGIHTCHEPVVFMRSDCPVCRSGDFASDTRLRQQDRGDNNRNTNHV